VLQDDGHLVGELLAQLARKLDAAGARVEPDIDVMIADEPVPGDHGKACTHDLANRVLRAPLVLHEVDLHLR